MSPEEEARHAQPPSRTGRTDNITMQPTRSAVPYNNAVRRARSRLPARTGDEEGFSTLEAVIVIPVVVIITMLVIQYVMLWHARNLAQAAAQNGLRIARGYQATAAQGQASAAQYLDTVAGNLLHNRHVDAQRGATTVEVTVHASVLSVVPFGSYTVDETASGPVERYVDSPPQ